MRTKADAADPRAPDAPCARLRGELERLGVAPAEAAPLAQQLVALAQRLPRREVRALLEGLAPGPRAGSSARPSGPELARILEDFAAELKKLDEGLRVLAAYLARLRGESDPAARTLH